MTGEGVLLHDIMGGGVLAVLLIIGFVFHKRANRQVAGPQTSATASAQRGLARVQIWILYWLAVGATVAFFFVWPRAESRTHTPSMEENAKSQKL